MSRRADLDPPRLAWRWIRWSSRRRTGDLSLAGDLWQEYQSLGATSRLRTTLWFWREALLLGCGLWLRPSTAGRRAGQVQGREADMLHRFETLLRELAYGMRRALRRPVLSGVTVGSLALGIGACAVVFSIINATLVRQRPGIASPDRIVEIWRSEEGSGMDTLSYADMVDVEAALEPGVFTHVAPYSFDLVSIGSAEDQGSRRLPAIYATADYLSVLGVGLARGVGLRGEWDEVPPEEPVTVISHGLWQRRGDGPLQIAGRDHRVIGVLPEGFRGHLLAFEPEVLLPLSQHPTLQGSFASRTGRGSMWLFALARLAEGQSVESAGVALSGVFERLAIEYPESNQDRGGRVVAYGPLPGGMRGGITSFLGLLTALVGLILLITCSNVAGMFLAGAAARRGELAVRQAVGSSRLQLVRQLTLESALLFLAGGVAGVGLAVLAVRTLASAPFVALPIPVEVDLPVDGRVLLSATLLTCAVSAVFGALPALQATRERALSGALRASRQWMRRGLVVVQVAASMVLLLLAGLFLRSVGEMAEVPTGFDARGVVTASIDLGLDGLHESGAGDDDQQGRQIVRELLAGLEAMPGFEAAAIASDAPLDMSTNGHSLLVEGRSEDEPPFSASFQRVGGDYLAALDVQLLEGRSLPDPAPVGEPVVLVNAEFARQAWPGQPALGRWVDIGRGDAELRRRVIGVIDNVKSGGIDDRPRPTLVLPLEQSFTPSLHVFLRSSAGREVATAQLRDAIRAAHPSLSHNLVLSLEEATALGTLPQRAAAWIATCLGVLALLLTAIGLYGVISFSVAMRRSEIGIRLALGALRGRVVASVVGEAARLAAPGLLVGLGLGLALAQLVRPFLIGVAPVDVTSLLLVSVVVFAVLAVAALVPARRAAALAPAKVLRSE